MFRLSSLRHGVLSLFIASALATMLPVPALAASQQDRAERQFALSPVEAQRIIAARSRLVINALRRRDMRGLARFVHPARGVHFSPYLHTGSGEVRLTRNNLASAWRSRRRRVWGGYDGSGNDIRMTFQRYFARFVYDRDFARAPEVNYNEMPVRGNSLNDLLEVHPQAIIVEYHFPGRDPRFGGMDWRSLYLIYEREGREWFLVRITHDQWTI